MSDRIEVTATIRATDLASGAINQINRALHTLEGTAEHVSHAFHSVMHSGAFGGLAHNFEHLHGAVKSVGGAFKEILEPLAEIAGLAGGFSVGASLESYIGDSEHLLHMSKTLGITVDALGAYEFAARKAGVETESFDKSWQLATIAMRKGALGLDPKQSALFAKMHIDLKGLRDGSKSAMDYLPQLSEAMKAQTTAQARMTIARAVFGRGGAAMIPFLMQGKEAIEEQTKAYLAQNHITHESAEAAEEFGHKQKDLVRTFGSLRDAVGNAVTPLLTSAIEHFLEAFNAHKKEIIDGLTAAFTAMGNRLKDMDWEKIFDGIGLFITGVEDAVAAVGGWKNALIIISVIMNMELIQSVIETTLLIGKLSWIIGVKLVQSIAWASRSLVSLGITLGRGLAGGLVAAARGLATFASFLSSTLVSALLAAGRAVIGFGVALMTTPLGWILAAIALIAGAAYLIYRNWDTLGPYFRKAWEAVKQAFSAVWDWIRSWIPQFVPDAIMAAWETLGRWFSSAWAGVKRAFHAVVRWLASWIPSFVPDGIKAVWDNLGSWFATAWDGVKAAFGSAVTWLAGWASSFVPDGIKVFWNDLGAAFELIWSAVRIAFDAMATFLTEFVPRFIPQGIKDAWASLTGFFEKLWADIGGIFDRAWGRIKPITDAIGHFASTISGGLNSALSYVGLGDTTPAPATAGAGGGPGSVPPPAGILPGPRVAPAPGEIVNGAQGGPRGAPGATGAVKVDVTIAGAPAGSTVSTKATGNVKPDVGTSMAPTP